MSKKTWFKLYRGWQDNPMLRSDKDKLNWLWILENTVYEDEKQISINNTPYMLKRGQLSYSIRYLAKAWGCSLSYVRTFLNHLEKWHAIETQNRTGQTIITVCNYCKFQDNQTENDTPNDENIASQSHKDRTNNKKVKKERKKEYIIIRPSDVSIQVWDDFIQHRKNKKAKLTKTALDGIIREANKAGWILEDALQEICARGWTGFKAEWVKKKQTREDEADAAIRRAQERIKQMEAINGQNAAHKQLR